MLFRNRTGWLAIATSLFLATTARAAIFIDFEVGGQSAIAPGNAAIVVDIYLTATGATRVSGYQFAIIYDVNPTLNDEATNGRTLVNMPTFANNGSWISGGAGLNLNTGDAFAAAISNSTITTPNDDITAAHGKVHIGSITFDAVT